jgi:hypothetical protein
MIYQLLGPGRKVGFEVRGIFIKSGIDSVNELDEFIDRINLAHQQGLVFLENIRCNLLPGKTLAVMLLEQTDVFYEILQFGFQKPFEMSHTIGHGRLHQPEYYRFADCFQSGTGREDHCQGGAPTRAGMELGITPMVPQYMKHHGQTKTGAATLLLGGEEGVKGPL